MRNIFKWLSRKESKGDNIEGWNNLQWGMTEEGILKAFEGQVEQLMESLHFAELYANLKIRDFEIGGIQHELLFQMDVHTNRLGQILLRPKGNPSQNNFNEVEKTLIQRYGTPHHTANEEEGAYQKYERTWHFPATTIILHFINFGLPTDSTETTKIMTLRYRPNKVTMVKTKAELAKYGTDKELAVYSISDSVKNIIFVTVNTFICFVLVRVFETVGSIISLIWVIALLVFALHALWTLGLTIVGFLPRFAMLFVYLTGYKREGKSFLWALLIAVIYVINVCVYSLLAWYLFNYQIYKFGLLI